MVSNTDNIIVIIAENINSISLPNFIDNNESITEDINPIKLRIKPIFDFFILF